MTNYVYFLIEYIHQSWRNYLSIKPFLSHVTLNRRKTQTPDQDDLAKYVTRAEGHLNYCDFLFNHRSPSFQVSHIIEVKYCIFQGMSLARWKMKTVLTVCFPSMLWFEPPHFTEVRATGRHGSQTQYYQEHCWPFRKMLWGTICP